MKQFNSATALMVSLLLLIGALSISTFTFLSGMDNSYILIQKGTIPVRYIIDHYSFLQNKKGFIFSLTFLFSAVSFFIMIVLPSEETTSISKVSSAPEPVGRPLREDSGISAVVEQIPVDAKAEESGAVRIVSEKEETHESIIDAMALDETLDAEVFEEVKEGEDDVVYGTGPISDAAIIHFVNKFPDSALKFLYRKQLDGKALTSTEDEIYLSWEQRQMTRGKIKSYIKALLDWKELPKRPLYEIWKELRDHIFENVG
ncbi:MAG: hypothetical protein HQ517_13065 [SAR324 cluster bacterium]|nr:hypothetical protein [SAR324 cluster bacterium]